LPIALPAGLDNSENLKHLEQRKQWNKELEEEYGDLEKVVANSEYNGWEKEKFELFLMKYVTDNQLI
jgi:hypothetical protein